MVGGEEVVFFVKDVGGVVDKRDIGGTERGFCGS